MELHKTLNAIALGHVYDADIIELAGDTLQALTPFTPTHLNAHVEQKIKERIGEPVAWMCRSKMTDYAISLLPMKIQRESQKEKGWGEWHPVSIEKYEHYLKSIGKTYWMDDCEFYPLYAVNGVEK